ncbi:MULTISPECIES: hypothetical protein [Methylomonas]|uniref:Lipoprotein n=2 Tax=Methylomonas TaxID=416 RepID=A0A126T3Y5_9GAMM|nr:MULTISPECIES: hypothetical protein [Methylomonas]AMK76772.1 hypothetical protein JT25_009760 [Methylomonas denitrificans]OAH96346.1 hypothetical protein A1342_21155 [Methylomonas methanica]TCV75209.1 hypothetical protein EDE11_13614 [Methylomonas methanica]
MKNSLIYLLVAYGLLACDSSPPDKAKPPVEAQTPLADAIKQPMDQARDAEKQIFESADRQKQQAEQM